MLGFRITTAPTIRLEPVPAKKAIRMKFLWTSAEESEFLRDNANDSNCLIGKKYAVFDGMIHKNPSTVNEIVAILSESAQRIGAPVPFVLSNTNP
jgi:hypothetical protein